MHDAVIIDAVRTPVGRHGGALAGVRPDDMAALVIREVVRRTGIDPALVEEVYLGCANQAGEDNRNVARMATLLAGLPQSVAAVTFNRLCASGLNAINQAARAIKAGEGDVFIAGGVESMSRSPYALPKAERGYPWGNLNAYDTTLGWRFPNPRMEAMFPLEAMGETAENIYELSCDATGPLTGGPISREEQDAFALESQRKAVEAIRAGRFHDEIVPVEIPQRKGPPVIVDTDEHPRYRRNATGEVELDTNLEQLAKLRPAFRKDGTVTAGNSSGINDGAAA
ncbi:MAG: acetyl-CoA C-acyltransferase, partial [Anaerolineae bacterium]|nr:acetyl-CoA C-acyltransferase [Anaerolineae bacterium]